MTRPNHRGLPALFNSMRADRRLAIVAVPVALALTHAATATPYAGVVRSAQATFRFTGADRRPYQLTARVMASVAGTEMERYVVFRLTQCDAKQRCTLNKLWQQDLAITDVTMSPDGAQTTVTTAIAGRPVTIEWARTGTSAGGVVVIVGTSVDQTDTYTAVASLVFSGAACSDTHATAYERRGAAVSGSPFSGGQAAPATLPRGLGKTVRCP